MKWRETSNRTLAQLNQHTTIHSSSLFENGRADECWLLKSNAPQGNSPAFLCELVNKGRAAVPAELPQLWDWFAFSLLLCGWVMGWWASQWLRPKKQTKRKRQIILNNEGRRQPKEAPWIQQMKAINAKKLNLFNWMELMRQWRWMNKRSTKPPTVARQGKGSKTANPSIAGGAVSPAIDWIGFAGGAGLFFFFLLSLLKWKTIHQSTTKWRVDWLVCFISLLLLN